jgi:hypothetical protein
MGMPNDLLMELAAPHLSAEEAQALERALASIPRQPA